MDLILKNRNHLIITTTLVLGGVIFLLQGSTQVFADHIQVSFDIQPQISSLENQENNKLEKQKSQTNKKISEVLSENIDDFIPETEKNNYQVDEKKSYIMEWFHQVKVQMNKEEYKIFLNQQLHTKEPLIKELAGLEIQKIENNFIY